MQQVYWSDKQIGNRWGTHRTTVWRRAQEEGFPQPVKLGPGCTRWVAEEIIEWEKQRMEQRGI